MAINIVILMGNASDAPRIKQMASGVKVANFSVATNDKGYRKQDGTVVPPSTEWHNVVAWGWLADVAEKHVSKGTPLYIQGRLKTKSYEANGVKKYVTSVECEKLQVLNSGSVTAQGVPVMTSDDDLYPFGR